VVLEENEEWSYFCIQKLQHSSDGVKGQKGSPHDTYDTSMDEAVCILDFTKYRKMYT
jgi:hypothetical protein